MGITCYNDRDKISSGTEEIQGNRKADLQLQLKVSGNRNILCTFACELKLI